MNKALKLKDLADKASALNAGFKIQESFRMVSGSLAMIDYKGIFGPMPWTPDYWKRKLDGLFRGVLALDLWESGKLEIAGSQHLNRRLVLAAAAALSDHVSENLRYIPVNWIVRGPALAPPHGLDVLNPFPPPTIPTIPSIRVELGSLGPTRIRTIHEQDSTESGISLEDGSSVPWRIREIYEKESGKLTADIEKARGIIAEKVRNDLPNIARAVELAVKCKEGDLDAIRILMLTILRRHSLPELLAPEEADFTLDVGSRIALCTINVPDLAKFPIAKKRAKWVPASEVDRKQASDYILAALCIRAVYLIAMGDPGDFFDSVAVNARQKWVDPATGHPKEGIVASLHATKSVLCQLEPEHLDAKACFRHLSGISTPNLLNAAPIRPIFVMNTNDNRIVANKDVASQLEEETNLAAMPWEDFEHLVSQVFEWMFANDGVEVKVTRASRDRGVDAIMFDPDPIRGGKYVLQAKRYTRTVDVAAVRDLYGTVVNEGANRGILVTTASYGPDAYEFAKDKPISLIDGPNLIALLKKHGRIYRIDLEEARRAD